MIPFALSHGLAHLLPVPLAALLQPLLRPRTHILPSLPGPAELDLQRALSLQAPLVKEGPLFIHRTKGKGPLMSSFKKLHFSLTTEALSFAKTPSSKVGKWGSEGFITPSSPGAQPRAHRDQRRKPGGTRLLVSATGSLKTRREEAFLPRGQGAGSGCHVSPGFLVPEWGGGLRGASGRWRNERGAGRSPGFQPCVPRKCLNLSELWLVSWPTNWGRRSLLPKLLRAEEMITLRVQSPGPAQGRISASGFAEGPGLASCPCSSPRKGGALMFWMDLLTPSWADPTPRQPGSGDGLPGIPNPALSS